MSEFKGTPRPWGIEKTSNDWWVGQIGPDGKVDLVVARFPTCVEYDETYNDRKKSDAHLVAAAPELFAALQEMLKSYDEPDDRIRSTLAQHYARKAIAKALGEEK